MKLKVFSSILFVFFLIPSLIWADDNFSHFETKVKTTYTLEESGNLLVDHVFSLKNASYLYFLKKYQLILPTDQILDISVKSDQKIDLNVKKEENKTYFEVNFQTPLVGEGKENKFHLIYKNLSSIKKQGLKHELFLNNLSYENDLDDYNVLVKIPKKFQDPMVTNAEYSKEEKEGVSFFEFNNPKLKNIYLSLGKQQRFNFDFSTHLKNDSSYKNTFPLAIPSDGQFQKLFYQNINPKPDLFATDEDGNWIISYILKPLAEIEVSLSGQVLIQNDNPPLMEEDVYLKKITKPQLFWESDEQEIIQLANFLKTPKEVYSYLMENLTYSNSLNDRLGALKTLEQKKIANCQSFSDLGVAILRAKKIPARRVVGFAMIQAGLGKNLFDGNLHSWIEYYYNNQWKVMDPTFGQNIPYYDYFDNFDLNHFTLVKNGIDSYKPTAIGEDFFINKSNSLVINFTKEIIGAKPNKDIISVDLKKRDFFNFNLPFYQFIINNKSGSSIDDLNLQFKYDKDNFYLDTSDQFNFKFLPFENKLISFKVYKKEGSNKTDLDLNYQLTQNKIEFVNKVTKLGTTSRVFKFIKPRWLLVIAFVVFLTLIFFFNFLIFKKKNKPKLN
jgi:hypothetical protein